MIRAYTRVFLPNLSGLMRWKPKIGGSRKNQMTLTSRHSKTLVAEKAARKTHQPSLSPKAPRGPARPLRRRRSPDDVQARILNAAVSEFAEHSFSGARIDRISKSASTVDRMIYYYFGSKELLYQAALERTYEVLIADQKQLDVNDLDPTEGLRQLIRQSCEHYRVHPEFVRLVMTENLLRGQFLRKSLKVKGTLLPLVERIRHLIATGKKKKVFRQDADPEKILMTVMSLGFFYVANQFTTSLWLDADLMDRTHYDAWVDHVCEVVTNHVTNTSKGRRTPRG